MAHPDNEEHSEFADRISDLEEIETYLERKIEDSKWVPTMGKRLNKVEAILEQMKSYSFGDQYGNSDFVDENEKLKEANNKLSKECEIYQNCLDQINKHRKS